MAPITCIVIDDEPLAIKVLEKYFDSAPDLRLMGTFSDPLKALDAWRKKPAEVLFLDINMPELDGISLAKLIRPRPSAMIFTTAHPEYAVESYELEATDYLLKPFSLPRFLQACEKIRVAVAEKSTAEDTILVIKADRKIYRIPSTEILYCQAFGDYVKIFTDHQLIVPKSTLQHVEQQRGANSLLRTHRTYLVNPKKVEYLEGNMLSIRGAKIPVSKSYRKEVIKKLGLSN